MKPKLTRWHVLLLATGVLLALTAAAAMIAAPLARDRLVRAANDRLVGYRFGVRSISVYPWNLEPVLQGYPLRISDGNVEARGELRSDIDLTRARLTRVRVNGIHVDYLGGSAALVQEAGR